MPVTIFLTKDRGAIVQSLMTLPKADRMSRILIVDDDPLMHELVAAALADQKLSLLHAKNGAEGLKLLSKEAFDLAIVDFVMPGMDGVEFLRQLRQQDCILKCIMMTAYGTTEAVIGALREHVCDFLTKPFTIAELRAAVQLALTATDAAEIEVISATPEWIELRIPCVLSAVPTLQKMMAQLESDLPREVRDAISYAFREMLNNAIEYGGKLDPSRFVTMSYVRMKKAIIYQIKDPGEGFDRSSLLHAAVNNPDADPIQHISVREEQGLRSGGFGIMLTSQMVDELVYNQKCNEVMFIKYL